MKSNTPLLGIVLILGYTLCSAIAYILVKHVFLISPEISPINAIFWGFLGATILVGSTIGSQKKERMWAHKEWKNHKKLILSISILTSLGVLLWAWSLQLASAGSVGLIGKSDLLITLVLGAIFLGEKFTIPSIIGAIIALGGMFLIANLPNEISLLVVGVVVFMRFLYALQSFLVKKSGQTLRGISFTFWRILIMTSFLFITTLVTGTLTVPSLPILLFLFGSQIFGAYLGRVCYFEAHKYLGIGHINLLTLVQPVILLFGTWLLLNEPMPAQKLMGAGILLFGLALIVIEKSRLNKKFSLLRIFATLRGKRNDIENPIDLS